MDMVFVLSENYPLTDLELFHQATHPCGLGLGSHQHPQQMPPWHH